MTKEQREVVRQALKPLVDIAEAYTRNALDDEARRYYGIDEEHENHRDPRKISLYAGRGGRTLLTLQDCFNAKGALAFIDT